MAEETKILHKGWLTTREGEKYAPATLIENVFSRNGTPYDTEIKQYVQQVKGESTETLTKVQNQLNTLEEELDVTVEQLNNKDSELENKLANFGDDQSDALYIIDKNNNVIAYVDENGVTSTNFNVPGTTTLKAAAANITALQTRMQTAESDIDDLEHSMRNIGVEDDDSLYIIDSQNNVIAYIDAAGVHSINFIIDNNNSDYANYLSLLAKVEAHITEIQDLKIQDGNLQTQIQTLFDSIDERLKNFDGKDDEIFFFIDSQNNVIAYIDADGIHTTSLSVTDAGINVINTLNIHDASGNVIAYIDHLGVHSSDFLLENANIQSLTTILANLSKADSDLNIALGQTNKALEDEISNRETKDGQLQDDIDAINKRTQYVNAEADDSFYIIDSQNNVIAYVDSEGLHTTDVTTEVVENGAIKIKYALNALGGNVDSLQSWRTDAQDAINDNQDDITRLYKIVGEDRTQDIADGQDHKTRLDTLDDVLALDLNNGDVPDGKSIRLDRLDNLVGVANENTNGTHEERLQSLRQDITELSSAQDTKNQEQDTALSHAVNYVGRGNALPVTASSQVGDIFTLLVGTDEVSKIFNGNEWVDFDGLSHKLYYLDGTADSKFYITDAAGNVIAYFDEQGLTVTDLKTQGVKVNADETYAVANNEDLSTLTPISLNAQLVDLQNRMKNKTERLANIESRLNDVSNVMDFIGAFDSYEALLAYAKPNNGDVAVVTSTATEYVYDGSQSTWVELGHSTEIATAIANLQATVGSTTGLGANESSHHVRLNTLETTVGIGANSDATSHEKRLVALEEWQPDAQDEIDRNESDITRIYGMLGENRNADITPGHEHKTRLEKIDDILGLNSTEADGTSTRLDRLDEVVGYVNPDNTEAGTHETRLLVLRSDLTEEASRSSQEDTKHDEQIKVLQDKTAYLDASEAKKFFIIDGNDNVLAYFDERGLVTTNIIANGIIYDSENNEYKATGHVENSEYSLNEQIATILNKIIDIEAIDTEQNGRLNDLEARMAIQEAVTGEIEEPTDENYRNHKTRLDEIEESLHLNLDDGDSVDGRYERLDRLDNLVGKVGDTANAEGTHEARLLQLQADLGLEAERSSNKDQAHDDDIELIFDILGETTHTDGEEHKTRLDKLYDVLDLDSTAAAGESARLKRLDDLVGTANDAAADTGTHEARIKGLRADLNAEAGRSLGVDNDHKGRIEKLERKTTYLDAGGVDTRFFVIDKNDNTLAYFDESGLNITDVYAHGVAKVGDKWKVTGGSNRYSINSKIVDILNAIDTLNTIDTTTNNRLNTIETSLKDVSNVMDFIGAFDTKAQLDAYGTPNNGDVAIVIENNTEYVYSKEKSSWIEIGYSTSTATAIANLQSVVGRTTALNSEEPSHDIRLNTVEEAIDDHSTRIDDIETSLGMENKVSTRLQTIDELIGRKENDASANTHEGRIKFIENRLSPVSTLMDYVGSFASVAALNAYTPVHHGDFACVTANNTEYVYDEDKKAWIEVGRSTQTANELSGLRTDLSHLQAVVGDTELSSGSSSHEQRIETMEDKFDDLEVIFDWVKDDTLYIIDKNNNTLAYFDQNGLTVTDVHLLKSNGQTTSKATMMFFEETGTYSF